MYLHHPLSGNCFPWLAPYCTQGMGSQGPPFKANLHHKKKKKLEKKAFKARILQTKTDTRI